MAIAGQDLPTERQGQILAFIGAAIMLGGGSPTYREIGKHFGIRSPNAINDHLEALERKGLVTTGRARLARTVRLTDSGWACLGFECCGKCHGAGYIRQWRTRTRNIAAG